MNIRRKSNEYEYERKKVPTMKSFPLSNNGFCMSTFCVYFYCLFTAKIYILLLFFVCYLVGTLSLSVDNNIIKIEKYQQHLFKFSSRMNGINVATHLSRYVFFCTVGPGCCQLYYIFWHKIQNLIIIDLFLL